MPLSDPIKVEVHTMEEKGSDVSLGCHLLNDAWKGSFDVAAIISNDADLSPPIEIVTKELNKPVVVICPKPSGATEKLKDVASSMLYVHPRILKSAQFPASIPNSSITKPPGW